MCALLGFLYETMAEDIVDDANLNPLIPLNLDEAPELVLDVELDQFDPLLDVPDEFDSNAYFVSIEQLQEFQPLQGVYPKAKDWKEDCRDDVRKITVHVDKARRFVWQQARAEIAMVRDCNGPNVLLEV